MTPVSFTIDVGALALVLPLLDITLLRLVTPLGGLADPRQEDG